MGCAFYRWETIDGPKKDSSIQQALRYHVHSVWTFELVHRIKDDAFVRV